MRTSLDVASIAATGLITAGTFSTTGTANLGSINTDILYVSTLMQSAGPISVGSLTAGVWSDTCKLEANGNATFNGTLRAGGLNVGDPSTTPTCSILFLSGQLQRNLQLMQEIIYQLKVIYYHRGTIQHLLELYHVEFLLPQVL